MKSPATLLPSRQIWLAAIFIGLALILAGFNVGRAQAETTGTIPPRLECESDDAAQDDNGNSECELKGVIESITGEVGNQQLQIGEWIFLLTGDAEVDSEKGPVVEGACVEIKFSRTGEPPYLVERLKIKSADDCQDDDPGDGEGDDGEFKGIVKEITESEIAVENRRAGERIFRITPDTQFDDDFGRPTAGDCVEVKFDPTVAPDVAREIETKREHQCRRGDDDGDPGDDDRDGEGRLYGVLTEVGPVPGNWIVSGIIFQVTEATELEPKDGEFSANELVKVKFYVVLDPTDGTPTFVATEIEEKYKRDDDGRDDDGNGAYDGAEGKLYGPIDAVTDTMWTVGGVDFMIEPGMTEINVPAEVGGFVEVKFFVNAENQRVALEISPSDDDEDGYFEMVGFITSQPDRRFLGDWGIAYATFFATPDTEFGEGRGLLAVGAYAKIEYSIVDGAKVLHEIKAEVPPGAGDRDRVGRLERRGGGNVAAAGLVAEQWQIDGQLYVIDAATRLNDSQGALTEGAMVAVNSYTDVDGTEVATSVTALQLNTALYLPLIIR